MLRISCIVIIMLLGSCKENPDSGQRPSGTKVTGIKEPGEGQPFPVLDYKSLEALMRPEGSKVYIVNFWATWCAPCIKELPFFEQITREYAPDKVEVTLVSLDVPQMWDTRLVPFVEEQRIKSRVVILDDPKQNTWIPKVDRNWSGAIPATLIYTTDQRVFYEEPLTYELLKDQIEKFTSP